MKWIQIFQKKKIWRESEQTSLKALITRELGKPTKETKQMTAEIQAGAVTNNPTQWHAINWQKVGKNVRRLQGRIVKLRHEVAYIFVIARNSE